MDEDPRLLGRNHGLVVSVIKREIPLHVKRRRLWHKRPIWEIHSWSACVDRVEIGLVSRRPRTSRAERSRRILASFAFPPTISCRLRLSGPVQLVPAPTAPGHAVRPGSSPGPAGPDSPPRGAWMHEPKGRYLPLAGPRRFIGDLVHFAHRIPSAPVSRSFDVAALLAPRVGTRRVPHGPACS